MNEKQVKYAVIASMLVLIIYLFVSFYELVFSPYYWPSQSRGVFVLLSSFALFFCFIGYHLDLDE